MARDHRRAPRDLVVHELDHEGVQHLVFTYPLARDEGRRALSDAERAVLALLEEGLSDRAIADRRGVTRGTLTKQVSSIFRKLGVRSRRELLARRL
jgi:DNA-binding NarL/FixJ family response regulator